MKSVLCVEAYDQMPDGSKSSAWCVCTKRDPRAVSSETLCGMFVIMPGRYEKRVPTCEKCLELLKSNRPLRAKRIMEGTR